MECFYNKQEKNCLKNAKYTCDQCSHITNNCRKHAGCNGIDIGYTFKLIEINLLISFKKKLKDCIKSITDDTYQIINEIKLSSKQFIHQIKEMNKNIKNVQEIHIMTIDPKRFSFIQQQVKLLSEKLIENPYEKSKQLSSLLNHKSDIIINQNREISQLNFKLKNSNESKPEILSQTKKIDSTHFSQSKSTSYIKVSERSQTPMFGVSIEKFKLIPPESKPKKYIKVSERSQTPIID